MRWIEAAKMGRDGETRCFMHRTTSGQAQFFQESRRHWKKTAFPSGIGRTGEEHTERNRLLSRCIP